MSPKYPGAIPALSFMKCLFVDFRSNAMQMFFLVHVVHPDSVMDLISICICDWWFEKIQFAMSMVSIASQAPLGGSTKRGFEQMLIPRPQASVSCSFRRLSTPPISARNDFVTYYYLTVGPTGILVCFSTTYLTPSNFLACSQLSPGQHYTAYHDATKNNGGKN